LLHARINCASRASSLNIIIQTRNLFSIFAIFFSFHSVNPRILAKTLVRFLGIRTYTQDYTTAQKIQRQPRPGFSPAGYLDDAAVEAAQYAAPSMVGTIDAIALLVLYFLVLDRRLHMWRVSVVIEPGNMHGTLTLFKSCPTLAKASQGSLPRKAAMTLIARDLSMIQ
jgi:hypothetical protein